MKRFLIYSFCLAFIISCKAQPQYYQEKLASHKEVARLYIAENRYNEALRELELARQTLPCDAETFTLLGTVYMALREYNKAEEALLEALRRDPKYSEALTNLGSLRMLQGRYQEAIQYFERALENPLYLNAYIARTNLGWSYYQLGDKERALNTLYTALRENAFATKALIYIALIHLNEGDFDSAEFYLRRVLKSDRANAEARFYLGEIFFRQGKVDLAREVWNSVIQLNPGSEWSNLAEDRIFLLKRIQSSK